MADDDPDWNRNLTDLSSSVARWTGNPFEVLDRSPEDLGSMAAADEGLLGEIRRDGRAVVGSLALVPAPEAA